VKNVVSIATTAVCVAAITACTVTPAPPDTAAEAGRNESRTTPTASPSTPATPSPTPTPSVTRPWKITLKKSDSCRIIRAIPAKRFNSSQGKVDATSAVHFPGSIGCSRLSGHRDDDPFWDDPGIMLNVIAVVDQGADEFLSAPNIAELVHRRLTVGGFPAFVIKSPSPGQCHGLLDVADGQFVYVWLAQPFGSDDKIVVPRAKLCQTVPGVLSAVLSELRSTS
jgi:Protein of unknown function (DUF3558)